VLFHNKLPEIVGPTPGKDSITKRCCSLIVKGLRLLARAIFVVGADGNVAYKQLVPEITEEPNYDEVLEAVKNL